MEHRNIASRQVLLCNDKKDRKNAITYKKSFGPVVLAGPPGQKVLGPVVLAGQDLETLKVPGLFFKWSRDLPTPFFPSHCILSLACKNQ